MRQWLRVVLTGASVWALIALLPFAMSPAHAQEIHLNSSNVQVVHNTPGNTDVLNLSLNVTSDGEGSCEGEADDLLETGVHISVSRFTCLQYTAICGTFPFVCPTFDFDAQINYVEHDIGSSSYGTSFGPNAAGSVSSKIVLLARPPSTCGTWSINLQATGQNLSGITGPPVSLWLNDSDGSGPFCYTVNANVGNGITKPHHGVHATRHR